MRGTVPMASYITVVPLRMRLISVSKIVAYKINGTKHSNFKKLMDLKPKMFMYQDCKARVLY